MDVKEQLQYLLDRGFTMTLLSKYMGCSTAALQNYLKGRSYPTAAKCMAIKKGLAEMAKDVSYVLNVAKYAIS